jgi:hypothetical protein
VGYGEGKSPQVYSRAGVVGAAVIKRERRVKISNPIPGESSKIGEIDDQVAPAIYL